MADDGVEPRRRCKTRGSSNGVPSPRNLRRSRRRIEHEERECVQEDEVVKPRKRRQSGKSRKEKNTSIPSAPASSNFTNENVGEERALDCLGQMIWELVMWRDTAKSSLWFGFGCLCFLSSCFTKGLNISLFSVISQLGLLFLAASFISNTLHQRENVPMTREVKSTEEDVLRVIRVVLPALNLAICKTRKLFSGEPSTTLKVAIFFLFGGEYGHFLTLWRLCTLGFFASFTVPKLYSSYSAQIHSKVEQCKWRVLDAWQTCSHKKIVALSVATAFWNLSSLKTRVFAAFVALVILRHYRQHVGPKLDNKGEVQLERQAAAEEQKKDEAEQALAVAKGSGVENQIKE